jgi:hypothetical protein
VLLTDGAGVGSGGVGKVGAGRTGGSAGGTVGVLQAASRAAKAVAHSAVEERNGNLCIRLGKFMAKNSENEDCGTGCRQVNPQG